MPKTMIKEIVVGQKVQADFLLIDVMIGKTKRGSSFLRCTLQDKSGSLPAVWWNYDEREVLSGSVFQVFGEVSEYQGAAQIKIDTLLPRQSVDDKDFERVSKYDEDTMWAVIDTAISAMDNSEIRLVATNILNNDEHFHAFKTGPAATGCHHAFKKGLLEHTSQMVLIAQQILSLSFMEEVLNKDLCIFGIIFHDFGKIFEYKNEAGFAKTVQGRLVPHIPMTGAIIYESCNKLGVAPIVRDHLMHVVLAHHGCMEYGSPVDMAIPEAAFVHYIDNMHGDVFGWTQRIEETPANQEFAKHMGRYLVMTRFNEVLKNVSKK